MHTPRNALPPDRVIAEISCYVARDDVASPVAWDTAHHCLIDSLGCALEALGHPDCATLLGPLVPATAVSHGARIPGTSHVLDPVQAAFNLATLIRWLDYNDAFYGKTVIHPSDALGGILMTADWLSRVRVAQRKKPLLMRDVLQLAIKAYEVMGVLALDNAFTTEMRLDHVLLVKIGCAAVVTRLLGGSEEQIANAVSNAWLDGHTLATFRRKPNAGTRKSWAAADAASRGVWLALLAIKGEMGYASALSADKWGFCAVHNHGRPLRVPRTYGSYVMENVQFKLAYPAAFHAQTAAEAAIRLHPLVHGRLDAIARVELWSHAYGLGILNKTGPLQNAADRDHCLQYIVAIGLIYGRLAAADYEDLVAADPRIDALRAKMSVHEDRRYTAGFLAPARRSNANAIRVHFKDGTQTGRVTVTYPVGHPRRRAEGIPLLLQKFERNVTRVYAARQRDRVLGLCLDPHRLAGTPVHEFFDELVL